MHLYSGKLIVAQVSYMFHEINNVHITLNIQLINKHMIIKIQFLNSEQNIYLDIVATIQDYSCNKPYLIIKNKLQEEHMHNTKVVLHELNKA